MIADGYKGHCRRPGLGDPRCRPKHDIPGELFTYEILAAHTKALRGVRPGGLLTIVPPPPTSVTMTTEPPPPTCDGEAHEWSIVSLEEEGGRSVAHAVLVAAAARLHSGSAHGCWTIKPNRPLVAGTRGLRRDALWAQELSSK